MSEDTTCHLCKEESENMAHFIMNCKKLDGTRREILILQQPRTENEEVIWIDLLLNIEENDGEMERKKEWLNNLQIICRRQDKQS